MERPNGKCDIENSHCGRYIEELLPPHVMNLKDLEKKWAEESSEPYFVWSE